MVFRKARNTVLGLVLLTGAILTFRFALAQENTLPSLPTGRLVTAREYANQTQRTLWAYEIKLTSSDSARRLAGHDGFTSFEAPLMVGPEISTEPFAYNLTVQQYRLEGDVAHVIVDVAHRIETLPKDATGIAWKSENLRFEATAKLGEATSIDLSDWKRTGDDRPLRLNILLEKIAPQ